MKHADKSSINVHRYDPPNYIIAFSSVSYDRFPSGNYANSFLVRYSFNYETRKMYRETTDANGSKYWEYIETNGYSKLPANRMWLLAGGGIGVLFGIQYEFL